PTGFDDQNGQPIAAPTLAPGQGVVYVNNTGPQTVTFGGPPRCPAPPAPLCPCGTFSLVSYELDCLGTYENITGVAPDEGAKLQRWNGSGFDTYTFTNAAWTPSIPVLNVGEAAYILVPCPTNPCITLTCATNKTVPCGSNWDFDAPTNIVDNCCTNYSVTSTTVTNNASCPVFTRTWVVTDTCGHTTNCSQTVTVVDTTPPVITCTPSKTVIGAVSWDFDSPSASDACCGTNVTIAILNTTTNAGACDA